MSMHGMSYTLILDLNTRCNARLQNESKDMACKTNLVKLWMPVEEVVEMREGQKRRSERIFPGLCTSKNGNG